MNKNLWNREIEIPFGKLVLSASDPRYLGARVLASGMYSRKIIDEVYTICFQEDIPVKKPYSYRQDMLERGVYLGHHQGIPARMQVNERELLLSLTEGSTRGYEKLLWSFSIKYVLTVLALQNNALHVKASTLIRDGKAVLLLGRGGGGKTTMASYLKHHGFNHAGNTHAIIKDNHVWAINSWMRIRDAKGNEFYELCDSNNFADGMLSAIYIIDYNTKGVFNCSVLQQDHANAFLSFFSAGIGNYDLKEDMVDLYDGCEFEDRIGLLCKEQKLVRNLIKRYEVSYLTADLWNTACAREVVAHFKKAVKF